MKLRNSLGGGAALACLAVGALLPQPAVAQTAQSAWNADKWEFAATIYGYLPSIGGKLAVPVDSGGTNINVDANKIIDSLKMTFMGTFDAHYGRWGAFTDVLYLDVGGSKSHTHDFSVSRAGIPAETTADINLDLKGTVWTIAGEYRVISDPAAKVDILAGARLFNIKPTLGWSIQGNLGPIPESGRSGSRQIDESIWDGIIGVKGRYAFGDDRRWYVPYYADIGTGQSDLTWQVAGGLGYDFKWGAVFGMWRYLDYNFKSSNKLESINFNGPMLGVTFAW